MGEDTIKNSLIFFTELEKIIQEEYADLLIFLDEFNQKLVNETKHLPYHINVIDELHINENGHSRILCKLLCFTNEKGKYELLESLIAYIKRNSHLQEFGKIEIGNPIITQEVSRIDLWVREKDKKYAIIFENKVYNAQDQDAQIARYIEKTKADGFRANDIFVVYLSQSGKEPDEQTWGKYKDDYSTRYINLSFNKDILSWLEQDVFPNIREKDVYLKSAVKQYVDYLEGLFFLRNNIMNMNLDKLLIDHFGLDKCENNKEKAQVIQEKINEMNDLIGKMQSLKNEVRKSIFEEWKKETRKKYPDLHPTEVAQFCTCVTFDSIDGKKMEVVIGENTSNGRLYCEVHIHSSEIEREIAKCPKTLGLKDVLQEQGVSDIWKYFDCDNYDGVFNLFLEIVERCKKLVD